MNPVLRESLEVFFVEGHGLPVYFYLLIILGLIEFLALYLPSLDAQMWSGSGNLLKVSASTALLLIVYFTLRVANQEFAPWRFKPLKHWLRDNGHPTGLVAKGQVQFLIAHIALCLLLSAPLLLWAAAIARAPMTSLGATLVLLFFYGFCYGIWGLVSLVLWERRPESRQVVIRCFVFTVAVATLLVYLPLNPAAFMLAILGRQEMMSLNLAGIEWSAATVHFTFHLLLAAAGFAAYRWALRREV